ncbi:MULTISPECIES: hypothetical protein [unclassified Streptomyces]|uniref:hypothetical protein n=1 Tax=unclassified Streptomyces TaxID=2593676 RepID=UPI0020B1621D|nr:MULTISPECIES: hypothetical protein [unclassified Streptomyces]
MGDHRRAGAERAGRAGTCARAALFAALGTLVAAFGHHAIAEGTVPWRLVTVLTVAQFSAVWPLARRRCTPVATVAVTLATQGVLHFALSRADGDVPMARTRHASHAGHMTAVGEGHSWHHAGAAMTVLHTTAALVVAWLLHRADSRMRAALDTLRTLAGAAAATLAPVWPRAVTDPDRPDPRLPRRRSGVFFEATSQARELVLEHAVVRRGPPGLGRLPVPHRPRVSTGPHPPVSPRSSLCPSPPVRRRVPAVVSSSPAPSR